ncbi:MAG: hypothetical protein AAGG44_15580 [Planctomycetota bacterium]
MTEVTPPFVELDELIALFYEKQSLLGDFEKLERGACPEPYADLLEHEAHMTVTVESRHECPVSVEVLESRREQDHYLRKILLRRVSDGRVVQFGIVRLAISALKPDVLSEIMAQETPLGRVLIKHNVLRKVHLSAVWRVQCSDGLLNQFELESSARPTTYGRTALIFCDGEPAVELLEIVAPDDSF